MTPARKTAYWLALVVLLGCLRVWFDAFDADEDLVDSMVSGLTLGVAVVAPQVLARRFAARSDADPLPPAHRAAVERALDTGVVPEGVVVRAAARDAARRRLGEHPGPWVTWLLGAVLLMPWVCAVLVDRHPAWLVATTLVSEAVLGWFYRVRTRREGLPDGERARLKQLVKDITAAGV